MENYYANIYIFLAKIIYLSQFSMELNTGIITDLNTIMLDLYHE